MRYLCPLINHMYSVYKLLLFKKNTTKYNLPPFKVTFLANWALTDGLSSSYIAQLIHCEFTRRQTLRS